MEKLGHGLTGEEALFLLNHDFNQEIQKLGSNNNDGTENAIFGNLSA